MSEYIDGDKLKAEIRKMVNAHMQEHDDMIGVECHLLADEANLKACELLHVIELIDSLQQEQPKMNIPSAGSGAMGTTPPKFKLDVKPVQPDVDLAVEIDSEWAKCNPIDEGMGSEYANISIEQFDALARHFYESGRNTTTQQVKQKVDFAEEIKALSHSEEWEQMKKRGSYMKEALYVVARHFYRLGLKVRNEEV